MTRASSPRAPQSSTPTLSAKEAAQIEWEYATEVKRSSALVAQLAPSLALDDAALDALFVTASTL
mgnify:CR=1 FL=1